MANKMDELHIKIGDSMRNRLYNVRRTVGGLMEILGVEGLIATAAASHLVEESEKISGLKALMKNILYGFIPHSGKLKIAGYEISKEFTKELLIGGYAVSLALLVGGYLLRRRKRKKVSNKL